ncbi:MAG: radical SAM family heme chaperone HemW [Candidatus Margulisbacteria bacterium]|nr:radical SAM family heme chaperone HemW [Candidatus Margulisiibacteriota bacterium]
MAALYIHIPFCLQKCKYCDFVSFPLQNCIPDEYVKCICTELEEYSGDSIIISTIYIGGGTPSLLSEAQLAKIIQGVKFNFTVSDNIEFTLEANPETYSTEKFLAYRALGVNRISLGVQSFRYLSALGRVHSKEQAENALRGIKNIFANVSLDLMNNLPGQTLAEARNDLLAAVSFAPQHISCYELTVEHGAPLAAEKTVQNAQGAEMYLQTKKILEQHGYRQYEISNYALAGFESRHNLAYWSDESYIGAGLAAHGYDQAKQLRYANTADLKKYMRVFGKPEICGGESARAEEPENSFNKIMLGLRKNSGIPLQYFSEEQKCQAEELQKKGLLILENANCRATAAGRLVLNKILLEFM